jgi:hypothetical protein
MLTTINLSFRKDTKYPISLRPLVLKEFAINSGTFSTNAELVSEANCNIVSFIGKTYDIITREDKERLFEVQDNFKEQERQASDSSNPETSGHPTEPKEHEKQASDSSSNSETSGHPTEPKEQEKQASDFSTDPKNSNPSTLSSNPPLISQGNICLVETLYVWQGWELVEETTYRIEEKLHRSSVTISVSPKPLFPAADVSIGGNYSNSFQTTYQTFHEKISLVIPIVTQVLDLNNINLQCIGIKSQISFEELYDKYGTHFVYRVDYGGCFEVISSNDHMEKLRIRSVGGDLTAFGNALKFEIGNSSTSKGGESFVETYSTNNFIWDRDDNRVEIIKDRELYPVKFYLAPISLLIDPASRKNWNDFFTLIPPCITLPIRSLKFNNCKTRYPTFYTKYHISSTLGDGNTPRHWVFIHRDNGKQTQIAIYSIAILRKTYLKEKVGKLVVSKKEFWWTASKDYSNFFQRYTKELTLNSHSHHLTIVTC